MKLKLTDVLTRRRQGDLVAEIDELTRLNREHPDPEVERRLLQIRNRAFAQLDREAPASPPVEREEPRGEAEAAWTFVDGLPEVPAEQLDAETIRSAFLHSGSLLVRGLLDPERASTLVDGIDRALAGRDAHLEGAPLSQTTPWFEPFEPAPGYSTSAADWNRHKPGSGSVWASDSPRMMFEMLEAFEEAGIRRVAAEYLGERPAFSMNKAVLRRSPPGTGSAWHQDGAFLGSGIRTLNVWLALNNCGVDAPGLDVVPKRLDDVVETGTEGAIFVWSVSDKLVDELMDGEAIPRPSFEPGDALLFDHLCLHRTGTDPAMTKVRYATETWHFAPSAYPDKLVPLVV
jgi:hypothetical protein